MPTEDEYREAFEDFTRDVHGGYYEHPEAFEPFMQIYESAGLDDDLDDFYEFLNTFYPDSEPHSKEFWEDLRERFFDYTGATDQNIDWAMWRAIVEKISPGGGK